MADTVLKVDLDARQAVADLELLAEASQRFPEILQRLVDLGDLAFELTRVDDEGLAAVGAADVLLRLDLSDGLAQLAAAVRAGELDAL